MKKNKKFILSLATLAMGTITLASPVMATDSDPTMNTSQVYESKPPTIKLVKAFNGSYDELVTEGIISQTTADKMSAFDTKEMEEKVAEHEKLISMTDSERDEFFSNMTHLAKSPYDKMVEQEILTETQKDNIIAYYENKFKKSFEENLNVSVDRYISENILSQTEGSNVVKYLLEEKESMTDINSDATPFSYITKDKVVNNEFFTVESKDVIEGSDAVPFSYITKDKIVNNEFFTVESKDTIKGRVHISTERPHFFGYDKLVEEKIITREQSELMQESDENYALSQMKSSLSKSLAPLVEDNIITQSKSDAIVDFMTNPDLSHDIKLNSESGTKEVSIVGEKGLETISYKINIFDMLVNEGILTEEEADKVSEAIEGKRTISRSIFVGSNPDVQQ